ncbi:sodium- and chloride-dependent transporter XTRP3-like isoform X2 [Trichoplusia ni]|uniref:Sodium- and chloride-dependent transporter XTRP3-like isoform X2 n=1 Tax=Trichoplusia ni TaxID=7111 RepID=A0A7E5WPT0_TRINI|nr:sodium- and chloride-dependent transporter XTRP3-like isoform X2 [Trichoplusia ni]
MIDSYKLKEWINWPLIRAHLCTAAVAVGYNATWRAPRQAFSFGGLQYGLAVTVAMVAVALPLTLLQLAVGQLSQQDAVGIWRAVPFFKGVGYLRLLISFLGSVYSIIYLAMTITYFLYTISNSLPFWECIELVISEDYVHTVNASTCLKETFMAPVNDRPEYFLAVALIVIVLWIVFPFIFYNPVKLMKRLFYVLGPVVIVLTVVVLSCIGDSKNLATFVKISDWKSFLEPGIWHSALIQALLSTQIAGGYLISAGDTVYSSTNVQWTALAVVGANLLSTWASMVFWYSITEPERDFSIFAVIIQTYQIGEDTNMDITWPLLIFFILLLSGLISMLYLLFPIFDRFRRMGGVKWRLISFVGSLSAAVASLAVLAGRLPALYLLEDYAVPLLISIATVMEILAFVFIYGWKVLVEDVEFLTGLPMAKFWVLGWCAAPGIIAPFSVWWVTVQFILDETWTQAPWPAITIIATTALVFVMFIAFASVAVVKQVQYDCAGKLKSSFKPSRHWGPRDPITHYYWLARREEVERGNMLRTRYHRRQLGQLSGQPSFLNLTNSVSEKVNEISSTEKRRSNSDDWIYTVCRKQLTHVQERLNESRRRAKSLDWSFPNTKAVTPNDSRFFGSSIATPDSAGSHESNNNLRIAQYIYKKNNK